MRLNMKKIIAILLVALSVVALAACGSKGGSDSGQTQKDDNSANEYYGTWKTVKLQSIDGSIEDEIFVSVLEEMAAANKLFYFEFGDKSYMYNPDGEGGYEPIEIEADFDAGQIWAAGNKSDVISFTMQDGQMVIDETDSGVRFYLAKE